MRTSGRISPRTQKIFDELAEVIIPSAGMDYPGAKDLGLVNIILEWLGGIRFGITALKFWLWFWELSPIFSLRFKLFTQLSNEQKTQYLKVWENSRWMLRRWMLVSLKAIFMAGFYSQPQIQEKIGYVPGRCYRNSNPEAEK